MTALLATIGGGLVVLTLFDVAWTTTSAGSGAGPMTRRLGDGLWMVALGLHRKRASQAPLSVAGVVVVFTVLGAWVALVTAGWVLVFSSDEGAVREAVTGVPGDLVARIYFTGYTVFTLGIGDFRPGDGVWQIATVLAAGTGLVLVTLSITYLVPVVSAVAQRRQLAGYIWSLGSSPQEILLRSWTGTGFGPLPQHLMSITPLVHGARHRHLTYPVLHYFHTADRDSAPPPNIANLSQALHLLRHGVAPDARPSDGAIAPLDAAIGSLLSAVGAADVPTAPSPLPLPALDPLRDAGIPVVDGATYEATGPISERRRALLAALLVDDGWPAAAGQPRVRL